MPNESRRPHELLGCFSAEHHYRGTFGRELPWVDRNNTVIRFCALAICVVLSWRASVIKLLCIVNSQVSKRPQVVTVRRPESALLKKRICAATIQRGHADRISELRTGICIKFFIFCR